jgi:hypothetical protein
MDEREARVMCHTPRPWRAIGDDRVAAVYAGRRSRHFICEISGSWQDALLVAAAPELLEALEDLLDLVETPRMRVPRRVVTRAWKAVARARGTAKEVRHGER